MNIFAKIKWKQVFFWLCTILVIYINFVNLYPWVAGNYRDGEVRAGTCFIIMQWFILYNLLFDWNNVKKYDLRERKIKVFVLPLILIATNVMLEFILIYHDDATPKTILFWLFVYFSMVIGGGYAAKCSHMVIWFPVSMYFTIYACPGGEYAGGLAGADGVVLFWIAAVVFGIIEYFIMLKLNINLLKTGDYKVLEKLSFFLCTFLLMCVLFPHTVARMRECEIDYAMLALFFIILWFWQFSVFSSTHSDKGVSYTVSPKSLIFILPFIILMLNALMTSLIYYTRGGGIDFDSEYIIFYFLFAILFFIILRLFFLGKKSHIVIWYPLSLFCNIYVINVGENVDIYNRFIFVKSHWIALAVVTVIEYIIMLILNLKQWNIAKGKEEAEKMQTQPDYYYMENPSSESKKG